MQVETPQDQAEHAQIPDGRVDISAADLGDPDASADTQEDAGDEGGEGQDTQEGDDTGKEQSKQGEDAGEDADKAKADAAKDPARREVDGLKGDLIDTRKELRAEKERVAELERQLQEQQANIRATQSRDFDAELTAIEERYDNGDFDNFGEFQKARDEIVAARASEEAIARHQKSIEEAQAAAQTKSWNDAVDTFLNTEGNEAFKDDTVLVAALAAAIEDQIANGVKDHTTILANAKSNVESRFGSTTADPADAVRNERRARQAQASAAGAAQVPSPASGGGSGMRAQGGGSGDLSESTAARDWSAMSKAQQDEALGKPA